MRDFLSINKVLPIRQLIDLKQKIVSGSTLLLGLGYFFALLALSIPRTAYAVGFEVEYPHLNATKEACTGTGYDSITWCKNPSEGTKEYYSVRGFYYRNCTDGASYWAKKYTGVDIPSSWGNANSWDTAASSYTVKAGNSNSIEPGDIAQSDDGSFGHVGFVTSVTKDVNGTITSISIAEMNKSNTGSLTHDPYTSKNSLGKFSRSATNDWDNFIDVNGIGKGLDNVVVAGTTGVQGISSQYTSSDGVQHVYSSTDSGRVYHTSWGNGAQLSSWQIGNVGSSASATSSQISNGVHHVYVGTSTGTVHEIAWGNGTALSSWQVGNVGSSVTAISSQLVGGVNHVYVGSTGKVHHISWGGGNPLTTWQIANYGGTVTSISSQITNSVHSVDVATGTTVNNISWGGGNPITYWQVANLDSSVKAISSQLYNGVHYIYASTSTGKVVNISWGNGNPLSSWQVANLGSTVNSVSSQFVGGVHHVYSATGSAVHETAWGNGNPLSSWQVANL